jgi:hypothetical protein
MKHRIPRKKKKQLLKTIAGRAYYYMYVRSPRISGLAVVTDTRNLLSFLSDVPIIEQSETYKWESK